MRQTPFVFAMHMDTMTRPFLIVLLLITLGFTLIPTDNEQIPSDAAISGYDPVAYFTYRRATIGLNRYHYVWDNKTWLFSSARHRDLFAANPEQYAPQFDGFCANGLSDGHVIEADPENWRVIEGKLYLYFSNHGREQWSGKAKPLIENATSTYRKYATRAINEFRLPGQESN